MQEVVKHEKENYTVLGYYAASKGKFIPTFRNNLSVPSSGYKIPRESLNPKEGTETLSRNVGKKLPLLGV